MDVSVRGRRRGGHFLHYQTSRWAQRGNKLEGLRELPAGTELGKLTLRLAAISKNHAHRAHGQLFNFFQKGRFLHSP